MGEIKEPKYSYAKLLDKARKLKALADRGEKHERDSAMDFYEEFIKKHNIEEEDIEPKHFRRSIKLKNKDHEILLSHIILSVNPFVVIDRKRGIYEVVLDDEDFVEVTERIDFFYGAFLKEKELFFLSFMSKFKDSFMPDEYAVSKHSEIDKKMSEDAEALLKKKNPQEKQKTESDLEDRLSDDILSSKKKEIKKITPREVQKMEIYKKCIDTLRYTKANRRIGTENQNEK